MYVIDVKTYQIVVVSIEIGLCDPSRKKESGITQYDSKMIWNDTQIL